MVTLDQKETTAEIEAEPKRIASQVDTSGMVNIDGSFVHLKRGHIHIHVLVVNVDPLEHSVAST